MSKRFKITAMLLTCIFVVCSTMLGVLAAKKISSLPLGSQVSIDELDQESASVGMINFLVVGVDEEGLRSDTIMLFSYDGYSNRVNVLSVPRDTRIKLGGYYQKLNAAMGVGVERVKAGKDKEPEEELIRQIKLLTGLPINYFLTVDFDGFMEVIEALGGVDFNVPYDMNYDDPVQGLHIHLKKGQQHLNGQQAHDFVRFRHNNGGSAPGEYVMGDEGRIYWQQKFMKEMLKQKAKPQYFSKITDVFEVISRNVRSNYTLQDLVKHIDVLQKINIEEMGTYKLPGESWYEDYGNGQGCWWYRQNESETAKLIEEVFLPRSAEQWEQEKAEKAAAEAAAQAEKEQKETTKPVETASASGR